MNRKADVRWPGKASIYGPAGKSRSGIHRLKVRRVLGLFHWFMKKSTDLRSCDNSHHVAHLRGNLTHVPTGEKYHTDNRALQQGSVPRT